MKKIKLEFTFEPAQAEAFLHLMDVNCMSIEQQIEVLNKALEMESRLLNPTDSKAENLSGYLAGLVTQLALCSSIQESLLNKIGGYKDTAIITQDRPKIIIAR